MTGPDPFSGPLTEHVYVFPVTFAQQRLLFLNQLDPNSTSYNVPWSIRMTGKLNSEALERSLNEIVSRHEILRTTFDVIEGQPVQILSASLSVPLFQVDLSSRPNPESDAQSAAMKEAQTPLDLKNGPLVRTRLLRLGPEDHVLLLSMHHIIFDGWSRRILVSELAALYEAFCADQPSPLPELLLQYADYAVWQRNHLQGANLEKLLDYWKATLADAPTTLDLPTDRPRPTVQSFRGAMKSFAFPATLSENITRASRQFGVTPFMTLLAGFQLLLSRYSGQDDVVVGGVIANRNRAEVENLIGLFANTVPLRTKLDGDPTFGGLLERVKENALGAYAHQDMPFERLVEELRPERSLSYNPLFQVVFSMQTAARRSFKLRGLQLQPLGGVVGTTAKLDLSFFLLEGVDGFSGRVEYNTDLFDAATIDRMLGHYQVLLEAGLGNPEKHISQLPLLTEEERQQVLGEWNQTRSEYPRELCLHELFEQQVERAPDAIACVFENHQITYGELNQRANQLARYLQQRGVGAGQRVGILVERSLEMMVGLVGIQKSGAAYVPLDPYYPAERLRLVLDDARVPVLLTQHALLPSMPEHAAEVICLDSDWLQIAQQSTSNPRASAKPEDLVYVIYTSGSTGRPKGVQVPHRAVVNLLSFMARELRMGPDDVFPALASFAFDMCIPELYLALVTGGRVVLARREMASNGEDLAALLRATGATIVHATPTTWSLLLEAGFTGKGIKRAIGAEPLPRELCNRLLEADNSLYNFYGPTETTVWSAFHHFRSAEEPVVVGRPLANTQIYILDTHLQPAPVGVPGEIHIAGDGVTCGYLNLSELTAEKFIPDPFSAEPSARMYKTGDIGSFLPDGRIEFAGRVDNQVKIRGFRVELNEIETVLARHASVQDCVVVAREDVSGDKRLVGYVVPPTGITIKPADLRTWVKERLPEYMVPAAWVEMARLPLSPNGKVDRKNLPVPDYARPELADEYQGARTPSEEVMAGIWAEVLRLDQVGIKDDFFQLGGHSLLATQVVSRIRQAFEVELPLRALFEAPTIAGITERVELAQREQRGLLAPPIVLAPRNQHLPLSFAQQRLWFLEQLESNSSSYNVPYMVRMKGRLQTQVLQNTLNEIVRRHETLRTSFRIVNGEPVQVIAPELRMPMFIEDLTSLPEISRENAARRRAAEEVEKPFDLATAPMLRAILLKLADEDHILILNTHHVISDRWSLGVLWQELAALYEAFAAGRLSPLPELPVQYADYAVWQREFLAGETLEKQLAYWKKQLAGAPASLDLPTDHPRPAVQTHRGAKQTVVLSKALLDSLRQLSRSEGVTLFMTLLAAFDVLLSRYSGQPNVVVGTPIAGRNRAEVERLIGFFVNTLALRTDLSDDPSFRELLARVSETAMGAYAHQDLPFEKLVEELKPDRDLSRNPLFQVMLVLQNVPDPVKKIADIDVTPFGVGGQGSQFEITLNVSELPDGLRVSATYNADLFEAGTMERMLRHFEVLLEGAIDYPATRVSQLPLLTEAEEHNLLTAWNDTWTEYPRDLCLHQILEEQAHRKPEAIAVEFQDQTLSYAELDARSNQLARVLRERGVRAESLVGVCMERSLEMVVALLGIMKAGGAYVPLDPAYPCDRTKYVLEDAHVSLLLTQQSMLASLPSTSAETICLDPGWQTFEGVGTGRVAAEVTPENLAYVIYTSGSTGRPKGVQLEHRSVVNFLYSMRQKPGLTANDVLVAVTTLSFDIAGLELYLPLLAGGRVVVASREAALDGLLLMQLLQQSGATVMQATPTTWRVLLESGWQGDPGLKVLVGGEALPADLARQLALCCGPVWNMYGPTETTIWSSVYEVDASDEKLVSIGKPIANTTFYILDGNQQVVPEGSAGELYIGGDGLARGYFERDELTTEKFVSHPFDSRPGARLYRTGDLARYRPDGNVEFLGRIDNQVKIRGFRIELGEIEAVLSGQSSVQECVVIAREDVCGDKRLVGYVVPAAGSTINAADLREWVKGRLPEYMVPAAWVQMASLPLTPNGKIDRKNLPAPDYERPELAGEYHGARTPAEELIAGIWAEVLRLNQVGVEDDFFQLGGHSLMATQVVSRIRQAFQVELPLRTLFEAPTVAGIAERVERLQREQQGVLAPPIVPIPRHAPPPLSFAQQRLWFLDQLERYNSSYNVPNALRMKGYLQDDVLERSLNEIVRRHETLRTSFQMVNDELAQVIAPELALPLVIEDLRSVPQSEREAKARRMSADEVARPFDLSVAPMLRATLLHLADDDHVLILNTHHSISDGWSLGVLWRELATLYEAFATGQPSSLPALPVQYADYAVWQRELLAGETLNKQLAYWKNQLAGTPASLELPTDRPRSPVQTYRGSRQAIVLPKAALDSLLGLSRKEGVTLFMTLLAAFNVLLSRYSGQEDVVIGTPIAGRNRAEVERLIGFFVNTLVMRTDLSGDPNFRELLARVRETAMGAYAHQDLPFEKLVEEIKPDRDLSRSPLFQVMLVLQNMPTASQKLGDLDVSPFGSGVPSSQFDLTLNVAERPDGLRVMAVYNTDLFEAATIERMLHHFQVLLDSAVANPNEPVSKLSLLTPEERNRILVKFNDTAVAYPGVCVHDLVAQRAELQPDAVAMVFGTERITYRELNSRANQVANYLIKRGAGPEVLVGIFAERTPALVVGILGILKAGSAYVPIDPSYPKDRLQYILEDAQAPIVLSQTSLVGELANFGEKVICLDGDWAKISLESDVNPVTPVHRENLAYVLFTSGSTGRPKGVALEHRTPVTFIHWARETFSERELSGVLFSTSVCFDVSMCEMFVTLSAGGKLILAANALELATLPAKDEITLINVVPSVMAELVRAGNIPATVETVNLAGEALPDALVEQIYATTSVRRIVNLYGPTETSYSTFTPVPRGSRVTIGKPIANSQCYVLDKRLDPVPIGVPGDLYIAGDNEARGYYGHPELTRERFVPDPFSPVSGGRMYRTGDVCRWLADGNIQYLGRSDFQVKLRGYRIELGEIEATLDSHPGVLQSVATVREDQPGQQRLVGYVVPREDVTLEPSALQGHVRQKLPEFMVPGAVVILDAFPLTPNGKIDRRALPAPDWSQLGTAEKSAPKDNLELILLRIWEKVLGVANIGVDDNFFELGGHSVLAVRLLTEIEKVVGRSIALASLFRGSTVASLAQLIREGAESDPEPLVVEFQAGYGGTPPIFSVAAPGVRSLGYAQLARHLGDHQPFYKLQGQSPVVRNRPLNLHELRTLAQQYVSGMIAVQREGPYYLIAMCGGCQIAEQMILQLEARGQEVRLFAILDTWVMENAHRRWAWYLFGYQQRLHWLRKVTIRERISWLGTAVKSRLRIWFGKAKASKPWAERYWPENFTPPRFRAPILLFKRPKQQFYYVDDPQMGWGSRSEGGVEIHDIDVLHHQFLREPQVQTVSKAMLARLRPENSGAETTSANAMAATAAVELPSR